MGIVEVRFEVLVIPLGSNWDVTSCFSSFLDTCVARDRMMEQMNHYELCTRYCTIHNNPVKEATSDSAASARLHHRQVTD